MPAIQPARLRLQAAQLANEFFQPEQYARSLRNLLEFYADYTHRPGQAGEPPPLLKSYNVPAPVLRQVHRELVPLAHSDHGAALLLCDSLWRQPNLESRLLATSLLGSLPTDQPDAILERASDWVQTTTEESLVESILDPGLGRVRREAPQVFLSLIENWIESSSLPIKRAGLQALRHLANDPSYENLPSLFRILAPLVRVCPPNLDLDVIENLSALAHRAPQETAYFLNQNIESPESVDTAWLVRRVMPEFPLEIRRKLRLSLAKPRT